MLEQLNICLFILLCDLSDRGEKTSLLGVTLWFLGRWVWDPQNSALLVCLVDVHLIVVCCSTLVLLALCRQIEMETAAGLPLEVATHTHTQTQNNTLVSGSSLALILQRSL